MKKLIHVGFVLIVFFVIAFGIALMLKQPRLKQQQKMK